MASYLSLQSLQEKKKTEKNYSTLLRHINNKNPSCGNKEMFIGGHLEGDEINALHELVINHCPKGDIVEKDKIIIDAKINGDLKSENIETHSNSNIKGNIKAKKANLGGKIKGNVSADKINIKKTADIDGVLNQKTLSIEEGASLKIKTETYK